MKVDLVLALVAMVGFICASIYATILGSEIIPLAAIITYDLMSLFLAFILFAYGIGEIQLRRYKRINWFNRMGMRESASLLERIPKCHMF